MRRNHRGLLWLGISILAVLGLSTALLVQASPEFDAGAPVVTDWSHHHVIFSRPATAEQAERVARDPRYWQQLRRQSPATLPEVETGAALASTLQSGSNESSPGKNQGLSGDWAEDMGSGATMGAGNYPAKFSFNSTTASCATDFVVYSTELAAGKASLVAYNNLYSGCTAPVPAVYWAFNTGGQILTSPVLSGTGAQVAFVQSNAGTASLVLLKWKASSGTLASPVAPTSVSNSAYPTCTTPCMTTLALVDSSVAANDSNSSPFYDYGDDTIYLGDDSGYLHKFTPVFVGTHGPSEVTTGGWPTKVNSSAATALTNPVYDFGSTNVFVEDKGGYLYRVNSAGTATQSGLLDHSTALDGGPGMVQGPIVDSSAGLVYVFATSDGNLDCAGPADCAVVYVATTSFAANNVPTAPNSKVNIGTSTAHGTAPKSLFIGAFDSAYEGSTDPPTGNLYVCGDTGLDAILYRVPIAAGVFGTVVPIVTTTPAGNHRACAPVTDVSNPNTAVGTLERVFFSVVNNGLPTLCAGGGCALSFVDTPWQANTLYNVGQEVLVLRTNNTPWIQVAIANGTTSGTEPTWGATVGGIIGDGTVTWMNQGATTLTALAGWATGHHNLHARILDGKGNVEIVTTAGNSAGAAPNWNTTAGVTTVDGTVIWTNAGVLPSAALPATGGTSGFIIDNVVGSVTQVGASQVYFSTLGNQACTGGTGGCAVQASQSALK